MNQIKWIMSFFLLIVVTLSVIALFNYIVDPYGLYRTVNFKGFNQQKEGVRTNIRYVKALEISLRKPRTVIMGSSRVHDSINPNNKIFQNYQPVYNYGIDMARIKEIKYYLLHAIKNSSIENVFIGLDYFMFNKYERLNFTFDKEIVNKKISFFDIYFKPLFTISALKGSIGTVRESIKQPIREEFLQDGYRPAKYVFYGLKDYKKLHLSTNWIFLSLRNKQTLYYAKMLTDEEAFNDLKEILAICRKYKINIELYINPAHANLDGEGLLEAELYDNFENWKRKIVKISVNEHVTLRDFSGYNFVTTEQVKTPMINYWDSSHFTERIGDDIFDIIINDKSIQEHFGLKLNNSNINEHLLYIREKMKKYHEEHETMLNELHKMYKKALKGDKQDTKLIQGIF